MSEPRGVKFELKIEEVILKHAMELCLHLYHNLKICTSTFFISSHFFHCFSIVCTCVHNNVLVYVVLTCSVSSVMNSSEAFAHSAGRIKVISPIRHAGFPKNREVN